MHNPFGTITTRLPSLDVAPAPPPDTRAIVVGVERQGRMLVMHVERCGKRTTIETFAPLSLDVTALHDALLGEV